MTHTGTDTRPPPAAPVRAVYDLTGVVQGVGFRPALYRLARAAGLGGSVQNRTGVVRLTLEGAPEAVQSFMDALPASLPAPARISHAIPIAPPDPLPAGTMPRPFTIVSSDDTDAVDVVIPPDLAMCDACRAELLDPHDRRYGYAFTTCAACGPRYTVITSMPYDRERTSMAAFPMCDACAGEYRDPADRRFHAETTACPECGPRLSLRDASDRPVPGDPMAATRQALHEGAIVAVRGIGGFLLACDPFNRTALTALRERKQRPHKPFALMAANLQTVRCYAAVPASAEAALTAPTRPIVVVDPHGYDIASPLKALPFDLISPDAGTLGIMLPTSPLHALLFEPLADDPTPPFELLVMTSGNRGGEPICLTDDEAHDRLHGIADYYLSHDRDITLRNDDSLLAVQGNRAQVWRRARGYAPAPVTVEPPLQRVVLATGAELKNTMALGYDDRVVLSPHVGDLETLEANDGFERVASCLPAFLDKRPELVAVDLHPDMHSTRYGQRLADEQEIPLIEIQHHHAHAAACLAEHGRTAGLALVLDGTGLGPDGTVWGAELLDVQPDRFTRLASFAPVPLPGGDAAVRQPARQLVGRWTAGGMEPDADTLRGLGIDPEAADIWRRQCAGGLNAPLSHAAGRLFDAFAAALSLPPDPITYDAQAAIRLERAAATANRGDHLPDVPFAWRDGDALRLVDWSETFDRLADAPPAPADRPAWALAMHRAIACACLEMVQYGLLQTTHRCIALSGGVFMNRILTRMILEGLANSGVDVLCHSVVPPNDGGIALGQAVIAGRS